MFARLNFALADSGVVLHVADGAESNDPVHLVFVGAPSGSDQAWHLRHAIRVGANARLTLVEHHLAAGTHAHFANATMALELQPGAD